MPRRDLILVWPLYFFALVVTVSIGMGTVATGAIGMTAIAHLTTSRGRAALPPRPVIIALAAYLAVHALADLLAAPHPVRWDKWIDESWLKLLLVTVPVLGVGHRDHVERAVKLAIGVGTLVALYGCWQFFSGEDLVRGTGFSRFGGFYATRGLLNHHLSFAGQLLLLTLFAAAWALNGAGEGRRRVWRLVPVLVLFAALVTTFARGPLVGLAAGFLVIVLALSARGRRVALGLAAAATLMVLALPAVRGHFLKLFTGSQETRLNLWRSSLDGVAHRPLLGFGQGNFDAVMEGHRVEGYYDVEGHAHNDFVMHAVNAGVLGLLAALVLLGVVTWLLWRGYRRDPTSWLLLGGVAAQVGISVAGLFQVYQTDDEVEMLLYFLLGAALAVLPREAEERAPPG